MIRKYSISKKLLEEKYVKEELTTTEISKIVGCHRDTVLYWLKKYNIKRRGSNYRREDKELKDKLFKMYVVEEKSTRDIGKELNIDPKTVIYYMEKFNIPRRSKEESLKGIWSKKKHPHLGRKGKLSYTYGKTKSLELRKKLSENMRGSNNHSWKGGKTKNADGYVLTKVDNHPYADGNGYVLEHRYVMEQILGRFLEPNEIVHHINEDKGDNRPENLMLMRSRRDHVKYHEYFRERRCCNE